MEVTDGAGTGSIVVTGNVLANDTDPDDAQNTLQVVADAGMSSGGGSYDIASDGSFTYEPPAGVRNTTDTFTYTVQDPSSNTDTATVTITIIDQIVYYVDASAEPGGDGRALSPLSSLAGLPSVQDSIVFVFDDGGSGTTGSPEFANGVQLLGEGVGLTVGPVNGVMPTIVAAGNRPTLTGAALLGQNNTIRGLNYAVSNAPFALSGVSVGALQISDVSVSGSANAGALSLANGTGVRIVLDSVDSTAAPGVAVNLQNLFATGSEPVFEVLGTGPGNVGGTLSAPSGVGIRANRVDGVSLTRVVVNASSGHGLYGGGESAGDYIDDLTLAECFFQNTGISTGVAADGIRLRGLTGTNSIADTDTGGGSGAGLDLANSSGIVANFQVTGSTIRGGNPAVAGGPGGDALHVEATGTAQMTMRVRSSTVQNGSGSSIGTGDGVFLRAADSATLGVDFGDSVPADTLITGNGGYGLLARQEGAGLLGVGLESVDVTNSGGGVGVAFEAASGTSGDLRASLEDTMISGVSDPIGGTPVMLDFRARGSGAHRLLVDGVTLVGGATLSDSGMLVDIGDTARLDATVVNSTLDLSAAIIGEVGFSYRARDLSGMCVDHQNNAATAGIGGFNSFSHRIDASFEVGFPEGEMRLVDASMPLGPDANQVLIDNGNTETPANGAIAASGVTEFIAGPCLLPSDP